MKRTRPPSLAELVETLAATPIDHCPTCPATSDRMDHHPGCPFGAVVACGYHSIDPGPHRLTAPVDTSQLPLALAFQENP